MWLRLTRHRRRTHAGTQRVRAVVGEAEAHGHKSPFAHMKQGTRTKKKPGGGKASGVGMSRERSDGTLVHHTRTAAGTEAVAPETTTNRTTRNERHQAVSNTCNGWAVSNQPPLSPRIPDGDRACLRMFCRRGTTARHVRPSSTS